MLYLQILNWDLWTLYASLWWLYVMFVTEEKNKLYLMNDLSVLTLLV